MLPFDPTKHREMTAEEVAAYLKWQEAKGRCDGCARAVVQAEEQKAEAAALEVYYVAKVAEDIRAGKEVVQIGTGPGGTGPGKYYVRL